MLKMFCDWVGKVELPWVRFVVLSSLYLASMVMVFVGLDFTIRHPVWGHGALAGICLYTIVRAWWVAIWGQGSWDHERVG